MRLIVDEMQKHSTECELHGYNYFIEKIGKMSIEKRDISFNAYPKATSNIIIIINPKVNQSVEAVL